jgi:quinol monooxygenase YgiN
MRTKILLTLIIATLIAFGCKSGKNEPVKKTADTLSLSKVPENKRMITAKIFVKKDKINDFIKAAKLMIDSTLREPGCESYMLYQNPYEPTKLIFVEAYKNQAAIDAHFASSYFKNFGPKMKDWISEPGDIKIYDIAGVK